MTQIFEENLLRLFILVLNMSLTSSVVILAVCAARVLLRRAPRIFSCALWTVVLFRLLCPVSFSLPVSLLGALRNEPAEDGRMEYIAEDIGYMEKPEIVLPAPGLSEAVNGILPGDTPEASVNPLQVYLIAGAYLWLLGMLTMAVYSILSLRRLRKRLGEAVFERENIYRFHGKGSPFVYGVLRPRIYLPEKITGEEEQYILLHEQIHVRRGDAVFRLLFWLALSLHWFNPLVWGAFALSGRDMEMACDEAVIARLGSRVKKEYSESLLNAASGGRIVKGIPLAFGESDTGSRIKNVLRYKKPAAVIAVSAAVLSAALAVAFLANPAKAEGNPNIFYGVVVEVTGEDGAEETVVRIPGYGDVVLPDAADVSLYLERDAERIIMPGDLLRITFSPDQEISLDASDHQGQLRYYFAPDPAGEAESIQVMGEGFSMIRQEGEKYLFTVPIGMAPEAQTGDRLEIYHDGEADTTKDIYAFPEAKLPEQVLLTSAEVLSVDPENYDIWVELTAEETEIFLSEFGFGISVDLVRRTADSETPNVPASEGTGEGASGGQTENGDASGFMGTLYTDVLPEDAESGIFSLSPERLAKKELLDGLYVVYVRSISRSARGFDLYVTEEDYDDLPLFPFAEDCEFRVNWERDKLSYSPVNFDKFADLITQSARVINPPVYCQVENNQIVRVDLESGYYRNGFTYAAPAESGWDMYAENAGENISATAEKVLEDYYALSGTEEADIGDTAGTERIEIYTGDIGDGASGVVLFKDGDGNLLGSEFAHISRAGWNNIYVGEADGTGYILTVHIEDRDIYGNYGYQVYRLGETGEIRQIAGSSFDFGDPYEYDDEMFRAWADNLSYYLENSHLVLSSQEGEIRTERVSEADKYNYETLRREP